MLRNEGIGYAVITMLCAITFGNIIVYGLFRLFTNVADYAEFTYPFIPVAAICVVISLICFFTPEISYHGIGKMTLVERLREAE
jgi:putative ABC transport system permease protein